MKAHWNYFKYVMRHKWFVLLAGLKLGVPLWRLIIHDWSKFTRAEWAPYVNKFFRNIDNKDEFGKAWKHHLQHNKHHSQYWLSDLGPVRIPETYVREMVADWFGAGRAITGNWNIDEWYEKTKDKRKLHPDTLGLVVTLINKGVKR